MRVYETLTHNWFFTKEAFDTVPVSANENWEKVSIPYTWNALDGQDGGADYYRGKCWYVTEFDVKAVGENKQIYIEFEGASAFCEVYVNGEQVTTHDGGYSTFRANITEKVKVGSNVLSVMVSNEDVSHIYPQMADFTFYGGLYRDVKLLTVDNTHFDLDYFGGNGVHVTSEIVEERDAILRMHGYVKNAKEFDRVSFQVYDMEGNEVAVVEQPALEDTFVEVKLNHITLWQGVENPYLYTIDILLLRNNEVIDEVTVRHGFRHFHVDAQKGFFLNGVLTPLRGVSRHQDKYGIGNALTKEDHRQDAEMIRELGANTIRLAHYQHSQAFYDLCDEMGFILWAEIPFISKMNQDPAAHDNCILQMNELIVQNCHHTSICMWGISNEITIGGSSPKLVENLKDLNELAHKLDPTRLTTMAQVSALPMTDEQNQITDILSYNHYFGWYNGSLEDNEKWLDTFHAMHPERALGISEYGCEGIITYHNDEPKAGDYSEEYQAIYHEHMAKVIEERPWLWATHIWNMFDFGCDARNEGGVAGRNNKGLVTLDRKVKKDSYYLYQAYWSKKPMVHICSKRYGKRASETITVKVYSNASHVQLYVDGVLFAEQSAHRVFVFENVPLHAGFTTITAKTEDCSDVTAFERVESAFEAYHFVEDESETGVTNWFEYADLEIERSMTFNEGYYSIKDTIRDILESSDEAAAVILNAFSSMMSMKIKKSMLMIMADRTVEDMFSFPASSNETLDIEAIKAYVNEMLQKIEK